MNKDFKGDEESSEEEKESSNLISRIKVNTRDDYSSFIYISVHLFHSSYDPCSILPNMALNK